jgi:hypothetical protein
MSTHCDICAENYNRSNRLPITCGFCDYSACRNCCEAWVVSANLPCCMNTTCRKEWNRKFLSENFTKKFMSNTYKTYLEKILLDEQRALLPATQPIVEMQLETERIDREISELRNEILGLSKIRSTIAQAPATRRIFIRACTDAECRGFLSTQWKCGICEKYTCNKCHEIIGRNRETVHTCDPDNVATAELLNNDTKACPTCGVGIYKIEGCDQMFCTMCHTAFSWRTGRLETHIHNPHYFELMRRTGGNIQRNHLEVICGREIDHHFIRQLNMEMNTKKIPSSQNGYISDLCRIVVHNQYDLMPRYQVDHVLDHQDLRVQYLRKYIGEIEFKTRLQRMDKKTKVKREIYDILDVVHNAVTDILYRYSDTITNMETTYDLLSYEKNAEINKLIQEIPEIIKYANECLNQVTMTYGTVRKYFCNKLRFSR